MRTVFYWFLSLIAVSFCGSEQVLAKAAISEVMWMGSSLSTADEWVEIAGFDSASGSTALGGWTLNSLDSNGKEKELYRFGSGAVIANGAFAIVSHYHSDSSKLLAEPAFVTSAMSLLNTKLLLRLRDASGSIMDEVDDGVGTPFAGSNPSGGGPKASMERIDIRQPGTSESNWRTATESKGFDAGATDLGTPGFGPTIIVPPPIDATNFLWSWFDENGSPTLLLRWIASVSQNIISQTLSFDPVLPSGSSSLLLPAHATGAEITRIPYGSGFHVTLRSLDAIGRYSSGVLIQVEPLSKPISGTGSSRSSQDFSSGSGSSTSSSISSDSSASSASSGSSLRITEVFPDPVGVDMSSFVEVGNTGSGEVDLRGWTLTYGSHEFSLPGSGTLLPGEYLSFRKTNTNFTFNHAGGTITLKKNGFVLGLLSYPSLPEGVSFGLLGKNSEVAGELCFPTEGAANGQPSWNPSLYLQSGVTSGVGHVTANFSVTSAPGFGGPMNCAISFGDGKDSDSCNPPSHAFEDVGLYTVSATMTNACGTTATQQQIVEVLPDSSTTYATSGIIANAQYVSSSSSVFSVSSLACVTSSASGVVINEILPNPQGDDRAGEWVELRNLTDQTISLCSWILSSGLSRVSSYDLGTSEIPPDGYLTLLRSSTGIPLGNEGGKLLLLAPRLVGTGTSIVQSVSYDRAKDGYSYARKDDGTFAWTNILTPGVKNEFSVDLSQQKSTNSVRSNAQQTALKKNSSSLKKFTYTSRMTAEKSSRARASFSSFSKKFQNPYLADITSGDGAAGSTLSVLPYLPIVSIGLMFIVTKVIKFFVGRKLL